jgi:hypothetical protein
MQTTLRIAVIAAAVSCLLLPACGGGIVPNQVLTKPAPASTPAPVVRASVSWPYRPSSRQQGFVIDQRAVIAIRLDTSSRTDTLSSHAEVVFTAAPATADVNGSVSAFLVQGSGSAAATPAGLTIPFPLRAGYSARGPQLEFTIPREAVPCASTALPVTQSLRDLWFRPPDTLRISTTWEDSSSYVVCRDGIPLRATVHRTFRITGTAERNGRLLLTIARQSRTTIEGNGAQFGEAVAVSGAGSGQLAYDFDPASGEVLGATGNATLDFSLRSRLRTQIVRQTVEIRIGRS